ncbi:hypothetical protein AT959_02270 [Dechloromonas denitrificans]|uniref:Uncharacterized protein n=1 Tax=Dechloromonas denitrificans TaxID=281362 RepID=A0A133XNL8_9RHOO|nr:hypothetical protein [Dechloromonas denitrificans]KXB32529.1 hypothetical protein AT959_02270 [Dechloromonas denitrificans]
MLIRLHRLRERGWPIPRYQFAFKEAQLGDLTVHEERDEVLNRYTRVAKVRSTEKGNPLLVPCLLDAQLLEVTRERLVLSGIERIEQPCIAKIEDFAQTWVCWLDA